LPSWITNISMRAIAIIFGVVLLILIVGLAVKSCDKRRALAAQTRLEHAQGNAAANSAADAVNTVAASGEAQAASEAQTRKNEQEIRNAKGASNAVDPAVRDAGLRSLCGRAVYRDSAKCRVFLAHP
jgi:predicted lipid-binding transport protein (Tim44 family)